MKLGQSEGEVKTRDILADTLQAVSIDHFLVPNLRTSKGTLIIAIPLQIIKITSLIISELEVANLVFAGLALEMQGGRVGIVVVNDLGAGHRTDRADAADLVEHGSDHVVHLSGAVGASRPLTPLL